jgi:hypothetical protein
MLPFPSRSCNKTLFKLLEEDDNKELATTDVIALSKPNRMWNKRSRMWNKRSRDQLKKNNAKQDDRYSNIHTALDDEGLIDLSIDREERKKKRKIFGQRPDRLRHHGDSVHVVDLHIVCDYLKFFADCIDPLITLNIKGPLANLWFGFKLIDFEEENQEVRTSLTILKNSLLCILFI